MAKKEPSPQVSPKKAMKTGYWVPLILFLYCFFLYGHTVGFGFVLDDVAVIEQNAFVKQGISGFSEIMSGFYWEGYWDANAGLYRPLSLLFFAAEYQISPDNPAIHHFFNVLYYAFACILLFRILQHVLKSFSVPVLLLLTGVFIAHPIHTEVVANIKSRDEILALLFALLTIYVLIRNSFGKANVYIAAACFFLALLSKEGAVVLLPVILVYDLLTHRKWKEIVKERWIFVGVAVVWLLVHQWVINSSGNVDPYTYNDNSLLLANSVVQQKATAFGLFFDYLLKALYPVTFSYDYSFNQVPVIGITAPRFIAGFLAFCALVFVFFRFRKSNRLLAAAALIFLAPLMLTSNLLFPIGTTFAERFLFVPTIALIPLVAALIQKWALHQKAKTVLFGGLVLINLVYAITTVGRSRDWESNYSLFSTDVAVATNSARAHYNYGTALMQTSKSTTDQYHSDARSAFRRCLEIDSLYVDAMVNLSNLLILEADYPSAKEWLEAALKHRPEDPSLLGSIGEVCFRLNQFPEAKSYLTKAQEKGNQINLVNNYLGTIFFNEGAHEEAENYFLKGLENDPFNENLLLNLANVYAQKGDRQSAIRYFEQALKVNPANTTTAGNLQFLRNAQESGGQ